MASEASDQDLRAQTTGPAGLVGPLVHEAGLGSGLIQITTPEEVANFPRSLSLSGPGSLSGAVALRGWLPRSFCPDHSLSQFFLLSPLIPSCCRSPSGPAGPPGRHRTAGQHLVLAISQGPCPLGLPLPRQNNPASSNLSAGSRAPRLSSCPSWPLKPLQAPWTSYGFCWAEPG